MVKNDVLDIHTHTIASGHAYNTIYEMADHAHEIGLEILGISEHAPNMPGSCHAFYFDNLRAVPRMIRGQKMMLGVELNIMNKEGQVDLSEQALNRMDYAIASLHKPCFMEDRTQENVMAAYEAICKNPCVTVIGHPDDGRFPIDHEALVQMAGETHTLLELNNGSLNPDGFRPGTWENSRKILHYCKQYQVPVILGSDAHVAIDIRAHENPWKLVEEVGLPEELIVNGNADLFFTYLRPEKQEYLRRCWSGEILR